MGGHGHGMAQHSMAWEDAIANPIVMGMHVGNPVCDEGG